MYGLLTSQALLFERVIPFAFQDHGTEQLTGIILDAAQGRRCQVAEREPQIGGTHLTPCLSTSLRVGVTMSESLILKRLGQYIGEYLLHNTQK